MNGIALTLSLIVRITPAHAREERDGVRGSPGGMGEAREAR